jgi:tetratricopeptide (TPR) repeat protein
LREGQTVDEPGRVTTDETESARPVFISYATADRKRALSICEAIERRGTKCWISLRDVAPGENYQEAIVHALRDAPAMVLVFSKAANASDEIKKELSLASRYHVPVMALRIDDVEPSDAFAYELATRQWIDASHGWQKSIEALVARIAEIARVSPNAAAHSPATLRRPRLAPPFKPRVIAAIGAFVLIAAIATWWLVRPSAAVAHSMTVRLAGFQSLSPGLPATLPDTTGAEITAAFNADGVIGVSTKPSAPPGSAPAYALGGTVHRIGDIIRVITQFTNERSGVVLWSDSKDYPVSEAAKVPHRIAVDAGTVVRCGLFGASTYHKTLPDSVLGNYMQYCQQYWSYGGNKTLVASQRVVAAAPDFSWGWSAVANGFMQAAQMVTDDNRAQGLRASGIEAEAKALALDPSNSEALAHKAYLISPHAWRNQETLFKSAIAARPLDCGCEHYGYGLTLIKVGRVSEATDEFRAAIDMLALWPDSELALAQALVAAGKVEDAMPHFKAATDLSTDSNYGQWIAVSEGVNTGDYTAALTALRDQQLQMSDETRAALSTGYEALASADPPVKAKAIRLLLALPQDQRTDLVAMMLAALGANSEALKIASQSPYIFWTRSMRGVLSDPNFPAVANQLGLIDYWKQSHTRPDVCGAADRPPFCRMI